ncbi:MAG: MBOAT family protein [Myxococcales bacterium]|nr:MBOAT family protein [Myxococcales bacterium]
MLFNTLTYAYFFTTVFVVTWLLRPWRRLRLFVLLLASYVFYAGWTFVGWEALLEATGTERVRLGFESVKFVPLLFVGTSVDYYLGVWLDRIEAPARRKLMLITTVVINVGILVFFKYWNWGADSFLWLFRDQFGVALPDIHLRVELPIGISFFCFMSLSYVVDVYRRTIPACQGYLHYLTYISFFPHLVAGPIVRGRDLLPHLERDTHLTAETGGEGLFLIATGLFKKVVIGDFLATNFVDRVFGEPSSYSAVENLAAMYGYAVQVYVDFSGYSDIAIGSALLLGYRFKLNFDQPYKAANIAEFWRRWHISLSTWLRDYVYIPLGGGRTGKIRKYVNAFITMVVCGVWHGASGTYVIFGCVQGLAVAVTHAFQELRDAPGSSLKKLALAALVSVAADQAISRAFAASGLHGIAILLHLLILGGWLVALATIALTRLLGGKAAAPVRVLCTAATLTFVALTFAMFRAVTLEKTSAMYERLFTLTTYTPNLDAKVVALILGALVVQWLPRKWADHTRERFIAAPAVAQAFALFCLALALREAATMEAVPFVYFQF